MIAVIFNLLIGWLGIGLVISAGCLAAWWLIPEVPWLTDRLRRALFVIGVVAGAYTVGGAHQAAKAITFYQAKLTREINTAIAKGDRARAEALNRFDSMKDYDDGFFRD